jgi:glyoxylase-like metal-dependent hydrolase (beta-lactamase superfamily II)
VSFVVGGKYKMTGLINAQHQVERVQTWVDNPVVGDLPIETTYGGYRDFGGVLFPARIVQLQGGYPALDLTVSAVRANPAVDITTPQNVRGATPPPVRVESQRVAEGIYYLRGGSHHSVAVEMRDHIVIVEGPLAEERSLSVIAKAKELMPQKPVRFVINTHHHWDHSGGLRPYVDEGATIVTHEINRAFYEKAWAAPRTLNPDRLAQSKKKATFQTVGNLGRLTDGKRTIAVYPISGNNHNAGILMVYLPEEKILIEGDAFTPPPPNVLMLPPAIPFVRVLNDNVQRLKLDVRQILPLHGPGATTMDELFKVIGRTATN